MQLHLPSLKTYIMTIEANVERRARMAEMLKAFGFTNVHWKYATPSKPHWKSLRDNVLGVLASNNCDDEPFLVLEDDASPLYYEPTIEFPDDTDVLYLGSVTHAMPWRDSEVGLGRGPALTTLKYQSGPLRYRDIDDKYVRLMNMLSSHAIIFLNEQAKRAFYHAVSTNRRPIDVSYADVMKDWKVVMPRRPLWYQLDGKNERATKVGIPPKIAIATLYTPEIADFASITAAENKRYAESQGYQFYCELKTLDPTRHPAWSKIILVKRILTESPDCEWVFWIDADALITNHDRRLEEFIRDDADFIVGAEAQVANHESSPINTGTFLLRNGPEAIKFLDAAYGMTQYIAHRWWDQLALYTAAKTTGIKHAFVAQRLFNSFRGDMRENWQPGDFVAHFTGVAFQKRPAIVKAVAELKQQQK